MSLGGLKIRPASEFFASGRFSIPKNSDIGDRLQVNLRYYTGNYVAVIVATLFVVCLYAPVFVIGLSASIGLGYFLFVVRRHKPLIVNGKALNRFQTLTAFVALSVTLFLFTGGLPALAVLVLTTCLCVLHACLRMRSLKARGTTFVRGLGRERDDPTDPVSVGAAVTSFLDADTTDDDGAAAGDEENPNGGAADKDELELAEKQAKLRAQYFTDKRKSAKKRDG